MERKLLMSDFVTLFGTLWYRNFPIDHKFRKKTKNRSDWNIHCGVTVTECANLLGLYCAFEEGNRSDSVFYATDENELYPIAFLEWEWENYEEEVKKLQVSVLNNKSTKFAFLLIYSVCKKEADNIKIIVKKWKPPVPLVVAVVSYNAVGFRDFEELNFYQIMKGRSRLLRSQSVCPWYEKNTRWWDPDFCKSQEILS